MKLLTKIALLSAIGGATYAAPGGWLSPSGAGGSTSAMPFGQMVARAAQIHGEILSDYTHVQQLQLMARKEKDLIKLNCLNDKLVQMKPEMNIAEHAQTELTVARDQAEQQTAFNDLGQASDQIHQLREAAEQCIGKPLLATESSNEYTHPNFIDHPPVEPLGGDIEPPAYASPVN